MEDAILNSELPYRIYGGVRFYERMEIKNALAYAKLAINQNNDSQFERVINVPTRGIGTKTMDQIREKSKDENLSLWEAAEQLAQNKDTKVAKNIKAFFEIISISIYHAYLYIASSGQYKTYEMFFWSLKNISNRYVANY